MSFVSTGFIGFLLLTLAAYYLVPGRFQWIVLLAASYSFYLYGGPAVIGYLLFTTVTTYSAGLWLGRLNTQQRNLPLEQKHTGGATLKKRKQIVVALASIANFGLLYLVKYWNFTVQAAATFSEGRIQLPKLGLLLPLGLSFYIFQSMGYVIDCYRGKYPPQKNIAKFALFVSFFPQMVQGPISRFDQLGNQLITPHPFDANHLKYGIQLALWGYLKKLIIADRAAVGVNAVFDAPTKYGGCITALAVGLYCIQLYCDFSGGIDITRGIAQMFGIDLIENFRRPIFATTLSEYWRRWHISLGTWMRDYLFYPLTLSKPFIRLGKFTRRKIGGRFGKIFPTSLATLIVYFVIGIWHGANFRYIAFGLWNGVLMTASLLLANPLNTLRQTLKISETSWGFRVFQTLRTMALVFVGRYITRAPRLLTALAMLHTTVTNPCLYQIRDGTILHLGLQMQDLIIVFTGTVLVFAVECFQERGKKIRKTLEQQNFLVQWLCILLPLVALLLFGILRGGYISSEFIYKQF
ncbi:MAG: MBOAT family O-acyltransferase [Christensenellales bacterium]